MKLDRVTITGADDSVTVQDLAMISEDFPFVEWGVLFSQSRQGTPRYPSSNFVSLALERTDLRLSAHLCGGWVRGLMMPGARFISWPFAIPNRRFDRVQINHAGRHHQLSGDFWREALRLHGRIILQHASPEVVDFTRNYSYGTDQALARGKFSPLFDRSGGGGERPESWPPAWPDMLCGYAGGLGPDNIADELPRIAEASPGPFWIDMERNVRSDDDRTFDLKKVVSVLRHVAKLARFQTYERTPT